MKMNEIMNDETKNVQLKKNKIEKNKKEQNETLFKVLFAIAESNNFKIEFFHSQNHKKLKNRNKKRKSLTVKYKKLFNLLNFHADLHLNEMT